MHTTPVTLAASHTSESQSKTQVTIQNWDLVTKIGIIFGRHKLFSEQTTKGRKVGRWRQEYPAAHATSAAKAVRKTKSTTDRRLTKTFEPLKNSSRRYCYFAGISGGFEDAVPLKGDS